MRRILITGASGFMGRACVDLLAKQNREIHAISRRPQVAQGSTQWHAADVRNSGDMRSLIAEVRPSHLLHLAWCTEPRTFWHSPENEEWLQASTQLFDIFAESGGSRIVGVGSCAEYDWSDGICHEQSTPCVPNSLYGTTKLTAGRNLETLQSSSLTTAWARLFFLYGPGASTSRIPGVVISSLSRGEVAKCSAGLQERDFLYVDDAARGIVALVDSTVNGSVNVCSGTAISIASITEQTANLMGRRELLQLGAIPTSPHEPPLIVGDNSRLRQELGWQPEFSLERGLSATIADWQSREKVRAA